MSRPKGNPNFKNKWNNGETATLRLPKKLHSEILYLARLLDQGKISLDQIEAMVDDSDLFEIEEADRTVKIFINGKVDQYEYSKTIFSDRHLETFIDYPNHLDQWEEKDFKRLIRQLNLIESKPLKFIFEEILDHATGLNLIQIQMWEAINE